QQRHAFADAPIGDVIADRDDLAPPFVTGSARRKRIGKPRFARPNRKIRRTHAATFETHTHFARGGRGHRQTFHCDSAVALEYRSAHRRHAAALPAICATASCGRRCAASQLQSRATPSATETRGRHPVATWNAWVSDT